jgi:hypothetical protein
VSIAGLNDETGLDLSAFVALDVLKAADARISIKLRSVTDAYLSP